MNGGVDCKIIASFRRAWTTRRTSPRTFVFFCRFCVSKNRSTRLFCFCSRTPVVCSAASSGVDDPTYISTDFCVLLSLLCFKKPLYEALLLLLPCSRSVFCGIVGRERPDVHLYGLLYPFVAFVFQKNPLYEALLLLLPYSRSVLCGIVGRGRPDVHLYGLLCSFVAFVFQKNPTYTKKSFTSFM